MASCDVVIIPLKKGITGLSLKPAAGDISGYKSVFPFYLRLLQAVFLFLFFFFFFFLSFFSFFFLELNMFLD